MNRKQTSIPFVPSALNASRDFVLLLDTSGRILNVDPLLATYLNKPVEQLIDANVFEILPPLVAKGGKEQLEAAVAKKQPVRVENQDNGRWIEISFYPVLLDATGSITLVVAVARDLTENKQAQHALLYYRSLVETQIVEDITERKRMEAAARKSEESYRDLADSITDPFCALDENLRFTYWNKACERYTGLTQTKVLGKTPGDALPDTPARTMAENAFRNLIKTRQPTTFEITSRITGVPLIFEVSVYPSANGISVFARDITERRRTEKALKESEERFRSLYDHSAVGMSLVTMEGRLLLANAAFCRLLGYSQRELLSKTWQDITYPDDYACELELLKTLVSIDPGSYEHEMRFVHRDGSVLWANETASAVRDDSGTLLYRIVMAQDITARKHAEESVRQLSGGLIDAVEEERKWTARELHDGAGQALAMLAVELQKTQELTSLSMIRERIRKLYAQVGGIARDLQRISHSLHPSTLDHLGLSLAIKEYCETLAARHEELAVTVTSKSVPRQVRKDVALCLYRIVQEALGNIVAHSGATKARVELLGRAEEITLSIEDDGRGFDPEAAETKGRLGLLSMRERSRIVGGTITIRSRPAAGTRIDVRVPIANSS